MILLALILWAWIPDSAALEAYTCAFAAAYDVDCDEALAVAWIEGRHRRNPTSSRRPTPWRLDSPWKICGAYQVTGGRYGRPECALMIGWLWVGVWAGVASIRYWQGRCRGRWYCGYLKGNVGCDDDCDGHEYMLWLARTRPWREG